MPEKAYAIAITAFTLMFMVSFGVAVVDLFQSPFGWFEVFGSAIGVAICIGWCALGTRPR